MISSTTITQTEGVATSLPPITYNFELATGNVGKKIIIEPMLRDEAVAEQRARKEFMNNGYSKREISFETWRTDLKINDIILIKGVKFKITGMTIGSNFKKMSSLITGERYE